MKFIFLTVLALAILNCSLGEKTSYEGYRLIVLSLTETNKDLIESWTTQIDFDVWGHLNKTSITIFLSPEAFFKYKNLFKLHNIKFEILDDNFQRKIENEERSVKLHRADSNIVGKYARYSEVIDFLNSLASENPSYVSTYNTGKTFENRDLKVIQIKTATAKKSVWIDCGIHAREWISPATCIYIIDKLIKDYNSGDKEVTSLLNYYEFHILPIHNPDGYEYTHTTTRLWRKNRNPNSGSSCVGTDLNRNFGYQWLTGGSSTNPCSDVYAGPSPNSELEIQGVQRAINAKKGEWDAFFTLHSYGLYWFTVWGWTTTLPTNYADLLAKSQVGVDAFKAVNGEELELTASAPSYGLASGGSEDWATGDAGIKYAFCLELRPGPGPDSGYGFILPAERIPLSGAETFAAITAFVKNIQP